MRKTRTKLQVETPNGTGVIDEIYLNELGRVQVRVYFESTENWINYPVSILKQCKDLEDLFQNNQENNE